MRIDERRFDFIPRKKWNTLSKDDRDGLRRYRTYFSHYNKTQNRIDELKKELDSEKNKFKKYVGILQRLNYDLDHIRNDYNFSWSVSKLKNKKDYYNFNISRKGHPNKSGTLGSSTLIKNQLKQHYKRKKIKLEELDRIGWKLFIQKEMSDSSGKSRVYNLILDLIEKDKTLRSFSINRNFLYPI